MNFKSNPVLFVLCLVAAIDLIGLGLQAADRVEGMPTSAAVVLSVIGWVILLGSKALGVFMAMWARGQVVPNGDVLEYKTDAGTVLAGPANEAVPTGSLIRAVGSMPSRTEAKTRTAAELAPADDGFDDSVVVIPTEDVTPDRADDDGARTS